MRNSKLFLIFALFMVLLCCFSAVSASEDVTDDTVAVSDDFAVDEVVSEVDSDDESIVASNDEDLESVDDSGNESLAVQDVEQVDGVDNTTLTAENENESDVNDTNSTLTAENDDELFGQSPVLKEKTIPEGDLSATIFNGESNVIYYLDGHYYVRNVSPSIGGENEWDDDDENIISWDLCENITIKPKEGSNATIEFVKTQRPRRMFIEAAINVTLENIKFTGRTDSFLTIINGVQNLTIKGCTFENIISGGTSAPIVEVYNQGPTDLKTNNIIFENCKFVNCTSGYIIYLGDEESKGIVDDISLINCVFENSVTTLPGASTLIITTGATNVHLENNTFCNSVPIVFKKTQVGENEGTLYTANFNVLTESLIVGEEGNIVAELVDDNGNRIKSSKLKFIINNTVTDFISPNSDGLYTVKYTPNEIGEISVNARCDNVEMLEDDNVILVKAITDLSVNCSGSAVYGTEFKVNATLDSTISGENITFTVLNSTSDPVKSVNTTITGGFASYSFADLPAGDYTVVADYAGGTSFAPVSDSKSFTITQADSSIEINVLNDIVHVGDKINVKAVVPAGATGNVTFRLENSNTTVDVGDVAIFDGLSVAGNFTIYAVYNGDNNYSPSEEYNITFRVDKVDSNLTIKADNVDWGNNVTVSISTDSRFTGNVTVKLGDEEKIAEIKDGSGSVSFADLKADTFKVIAKFNETGMFISSQKDINVTVNKVNSTLTLGDDIVFDWNESGSTTVLYDGATSVEASVDGGVVSVDGNAITVSGLSAGNHTLSVSTVADENHTSITKTVSVKVNKVNATVNLNDIAFDYGSFNSTTFDGEGIKNVTATILNHPDADVAVSANTITVSGLDAGNYTLEVSVVPDENHNAVTRTVNVTVNKVDSVAEIMNEVVFDYGGIGQCSVFTDGANNFTAVVDGHSEAKITIENGIVNVSGLNAGNYTLKVTTNPDGNHKSVTRTVNVTVNKVDSKLTVPDITFTYGESATVSAVIGNASGIANASVVGHPEAKVTVNGTNITVSGLNAGTYTLTATTVGDVNYNPVTVNATVTVKGVDVPVAQALSTNVPANSQSPTFGIKLDKDATGNFTVSVDGKVVDTKPLKDGSASITAANLPVGNHNITISYSGDGKYAPITQNTTLTIKEPVKPTPKVTKKSTKIVAKKKTFKAKVKVKKYTITLKSGKTLLKKVKVTLKVKGKTYKATTNKKGKATFKIKNLKKKGTYKAVIKFKGNKNYKASSKKVKIKVKK